jgi:hypothetical protein
VTPHPQEAERIARALRRDGCECDASECRVWEHAGGGLYQTAHTRHPERLHFEYHISTASWAPVVPIEIDCSLHGRPCRIGAVPIGAYNSVLLAATRDRPFYDPLDHVRHDDPADASKSLADAVLTIARSGWGDKYHPSPYALAVGAAAAHAEDCRQAAAIIDAVEAELRRGPTRERIAEVLRSAADPAWVAARAPEGR